MKKLTGVDADIFKELVIHYLQGEPLELLTHRLESTCKGFNRGATDLFESIDIAEDDLFIQAILGCLNVKPDTEGYQRVFSQASNLHELLLVLVSLGSHHLDTFLTRIDHTKPSKGKWVLGAVGGGILAAGVAYQQGVMSGFISFIKAMTEKGLARLLPWLTNLKNLPLFGVLVEFIRFALFVTDRRASTRALFFKSIESGLVIMGLSLWAVASSMTPLAAVFLLAAPLTGILESLILLVQRRIKEETSVESDWVSQAQVLRARWYQEEALGAFATKTISSLLMSLTLTLILFNPAGLALAGVIPTIIILWVEQGLSNRLNQKRFDKLQDSIRAIEATPDVSLCPSTRPTALKLVAVKKALDKTEASLLEREKTIQLREDMLALTLEAIEKGVSSPARALVGLGGRIPLQVESSNDLLEDPPHHPSPITSLQLVKRESTPVPSTIIATNDSQRLQVN